MKNLYLTILLLITLSSQAQNMKTLTYATKGLDTLKMDIYTPKNIKPTDSLPVIIWMHGGGFANGGRGGLDEKNIAEFATNKGYIGISVSYRLLRQGTKTGFGCNCSKEDKLFTFNQAVLDFLDATNFIYQNSAILQVDTSKIIAAGSSSGAETALNAVYMKSFFLSDTTSYKNITFAGVMSFSGALLNLEYLTPENAIPTVLFHGSEDKTVPFNTAPHQNCSVNKPGYIMLYGSNTIAQKLSDFKSSFYFNIVEGGNHDAANVHIEDLDAVFDFLDKTVVNTEIIQTKTFSKPKPTNY